MGNTGLEVFSHRVLSPQFELTDSQGLCVFQLLDILHLLIVASELLRDQDLNTPADIMVKEQHTPIKTMSPSRNAHPVSNKMIPPRRIPIDNLFIQP